MKIHTFHDPCLLCQSVFPGEYVVIVYGYMNSMQRHSVCEVVRELTGKELTELEYPHEGKFYIQCGEDKKTAYEVFDRFNRAEFPFCQLFGPYDPTNVWFPYAAIPTWDDFEKGIILRESND